MINNNNNAYLKLDQSCIVQVSTLSELEFARHNPFDHASLNATRSTRLV
jgi:hypothetical protein